MYSDGLTPEIGDVVVCIDDYATNGGIKVGEHYTSGGFNEYSILIDGYWWNLYRFRLVRRAGELAVKKGVNSA